MKVQSMTLEHLIRRVASDHKKVQSLANPQPSTKGRGRPNKRDRAGNSKFMGGFALFTQEVGGATCSSNADVASGQLTQTLSQRWEALPEQTRECYRLRAAALRHGAKEAYNSALAAAAAPTPLAAPSCWGLGCSQSPLSPTQMFAADQQRGKKGTLPETTRAEEWLHNTQRIVENDTSIPTDVQYDVTCGELGVCKHQCGTAWPTTQSLVKKLRAACKTCSSADLEGCRVLWIIHTIHSHTGEAWAAAVLITFCQQQPATVIFLHLKLATGVALDLWLCNPSFPADFVFDRLECEFTGRLLLHLELDVSLCASLAKLHVQETFEHIHLVRCIFHPAGINSATVL